MDSRKLSTRPLDKDRNEISNDVVDGHQSAKDQHILFVEEQPESDFETSIIETGPQTPVNPQARHLYLKRLSNTVNPAIENSNVQSTGLIHEAYTSNANTPNKQQSDAKFSSPVRRASETATRASKRAVTPITDPSKAMPSSTLMAATRMSPPTPHSDPHNQNISGNPLEEHVFQGHNHQKNLIYSSQSQQGFRNTSGLAPQIEKNLDSQYPVAIVTTLPSSILIQGDTAITSANPCLEAENQNYLEEKANSEHAQDKNELSSLKKLAIPTDPDESLNLSQTDANSGLRVSNGVFSAVYSSVPVWEVHVLGVDVMRRVVDSWLNATQILKVAQIDKPHRTKILEREIQNGVHEKIQGGYGKYQGTWVPFFRGVEIANQYNVTNLLKPLFDFDPKTFITPPKAPRKSTASRSSVSSADRSSLDSSAPPTPRGTRGRPSSYRGARARGTASTTASSASHNLNSRTSQALATAAAAAAAATATATATAAAPATATAATTAVALTSSTPTYPSSAPSSRNKTFNSSHALAQSEPQIAIPKQNHPLMVRSINQTTYGQMASGLGASSNSLVSSAPSTQPQSNHPQGLTIPFVNIRSVNSRQSSPVGENSQSSPWRKDLIEGLLQRNTVPDLLINPPDNWSPTMSLDNKGHTSLHWAAALARIDCVSRLIDLGHPLHTKALDGTTPLMWSIRFDDNLAKTTFPRLLGLLFPPSEIFSPDAVDNFGRTILHHIAIVAATDPLKLEAAEKYMIITFSYLQKLPENLRKEFLSIRDKEGFSALDYVMREGKFGIVNVMVKNGAQIEQIPRNVRPLFSLRGPTSTAINSLISASSQQISSRKNPAYPLVAGSAAAQNQRFPHSQSIGGALAVTGPMATSHMGTESNAAGGLASSSSKHIYSSRGYTGSSEDLGDNQSTQSGQRGMGSVNKKDYSTEENKKNSIDRSNSNGNVSGSGNSNGNDNNRFASRSYVSEEQSGTSQERNNTGSEIHRYGQSHAQASHLKARFSHIQESHATHGPISSQASRGSMEMLPCHFESGSTSLMRSGSGSGSGSQALAILNADSSKKSDGEGALRSLTHSSGDNGFTSRQMAAQAYLDREGYRSNMHVAANAAQRARAAAMAPPHSHQLQNIHSQGFRRPSQSGGSLRSMEGVEIHDEAHAQRNYRNIHQQQRPFRQGLQHNTQYQQNQMQIQHKEQVPTGTLSRKRSHESFSQGTLESESSLSQQVDSQGLPYGHQHSSNQNITKSESNAAEGLYESERLLAAREATSSIELSLRGLPGQNEVKSANLIGRLQEVQSILEGLHILPEDVSKNTAVSSLLKFTKERFLALVSQVFGMDSVNENTNLSYKGIISDGTGGIKLEKKFFQDLKTAAEAAAATALSCSLETSSDKQEVKQDPATRQTRRLDDAVAGEKLTKYRRVISRCCGCSEDIADMVLDEVHKALDTFIPTGEGNNVSIFSLFGQLFSQTCAQGENDSRKKEQQALEEKEPSSIGRIKEYSGAYLDAGEADRQVNSISTQAQEQNQASRAGEEEEREEEEEGKERNAKRLTMAKSGSMEAGMYLEVCDDYPHESKNETESKNIRVSSQYVELGHLESSEANEEQKVEVIDKISMEST